MPYGRFFNFTNFMNEWPVIYEKFPLKTFTVVVIYLFNKYIDKEENDTTILPSPSRALAKSLQ